MFRLVTSEICIRVSSPDYEQHGYLRSPYASQARSRHKGYYQSGPGLAGADGGVAGVERAARGASGFTTLIGVPAA